MSTEERTTDALPSTEANAGAAAERSGRLDDYPDMLSVDDVAAILRIGRWAVYDAVRKGQIPGMKFGRSLRISKARLRALIEGEPVDGSAHPADLAAGGR